MKQTTQASQLATYAASSWRRRARLACGVFLMALGTTLSACGGCGPEPEQEDRCEGVVCERGVCEAASGQCANAPACEGDEMLCLNGYGCSEGGQCEATFPCVDGTCERGVCMQEACVEPESCQSDTACLPGSICEGELCVEDPCEGKTCERGVCARATGECVNAATCTEASEATACTEGFKCSAQACVDEATFCAELDCQQGVCDFDAEACVDAPDCAGEDANCLVGRFCDEQNSCQKNACLPTGSTCMGGGECVRATGECVNPQSCDEQSDCLPMNWCVSALDGSGPSCVPETEACNGGAGCPGNQLCVYDEPTLAAICTEAGSCMNSFDCADNRVCSGGSCGPPGVCEDDALEPNNDEAEASDYLSAQQFGVVTASVCQGDVDVYTFDSSADPDDTGQNTLRVELRFAPEDLGLGSLKLELLDKDGDLVGEATAAADTGYALIEEVVGILSTGLYQIRVSDEGGVDAVLSPGVRYTLFVDVVDQTVLSACAMPEVLAADTVVTRSSLSGASTTLRSSCADQAGEAAEDIFQIEVEAASYLTIVADAAATADVAVSLRSACLSDQGELPGACSDSGGVDEVETVNALVSAGTYFIVVQSDEADAGGSYTLTWSREDVVCTSADDMCDNADTLRRCRATGQSFESVQCGASGCDMTRNRCNRPDGDVCDATAPSITLGNTPYASAPIVWADLGGEYDPGATGCVSASDDGDVPSDGGEITYQVRVPAGYGLLATLIPDAMSDVSLYLVNDCLSLDSCQAGVNLGEAGEAEVLRWFNAGATEQLVYLIADSKAGATGMAALTVELNAQICVPGELGCTTDPATGEAASGTCDVTGTAYESLEVCSFGCDAVTNQCSGPPNDLCSGALPLTSGVVQSGSIDSYNNDYNVTGSATCISTPSTSGGDALYSIDALAGDVITASITATFDTVLWANSGCDVMMVAGLTGCLAEEDSGGNGGETIQFVAPADGTYYIAVAAYFSSGNGTFDLTVDVQTPDCVPGDPDVCDATGTDLRICNSLGLYEIVPCGGSCGQLQPDVCDPAPGELCDTAIPLTSGVPANGAIDPYSNDYNVTSSPGCSSTPSTNGGDVVYSIDALAGDVVTASITATFDTVLWANSGCDVMMVAGLTGCLAEEDSGGNGGEVIQFVAPADGTYYIAVAAYFSSGNGTFTLDVDVQAPQCVPGDPSVCDPMNASDLLFCDSLGLYNTPYTCSSGACAGGACVAPSGDICLEAIAASLGVPVSGDTSMATNQNNVGGGGSGCNFQSTSGGDVVYAVEVLPGDVGNVLSAQLTSTTAEVMLWISEACEDANAGVTSCLSAKRVTANGSGAVQLVLAQEGTYYVTVAATSSSLPALFDLNIEVLAPQCQLGDPTFCDANGTDLTYCNALGVYETLSCNGTCGQIVPGRCDMPGGEICTDAIPLTSGVLVSGTIVGFNNDHSVGSDCSPRPSTNGADVIYSIDALAGDVISADLNAAFDAVIWGSGGCNGLGDLPLCQEASDFPEEIEFVAPADGTYYIAVAAWSSSGSGTFDLTVSARTPECTPGDPGLCDPMNASDLLFCNPSGFYEPYTCSSGVCAGGACVAPSGDSCVEAIAASLGVPVSGDTSMATNQNDVGGGGNGCSFQTTSGGDLVYSVEVLPSDVGNILSAQLTSTTAEVMVWISEACEDANAGVTSCLNAQRVSANGSGAAQLLLAQEGTYYVTVAATSSSLPALFDLSVDLIVPQCLPSDPLFCDMNGTDLTYCNTLGVYETYTCGGATGTCTVDACDSALGDFCLDALPLMPNTTVSGTTVGFTNLHNVPSGCVFPPSTNGADTVYAIDLLAGESVSASLTATYDTVLWAAGSCSSGVFSQCLDADDAFSNGGETIQFTAAADGTYYIAVAAYFSFGVGTYDLTVNVTP